MKNPEQLTRVNQEMLDTAVRFAKIALDSAERMAKLQMDAARESLQEQVESAKALSSVKDANALMALRSRQAEESVEKALNYSRRLYEVASQSQAEMAQILEDRMNTLSKGMVAVIDEAVKSAPAGSEVAVNAVKSSVAATAAAVDNMTKAAKQVADFADASIKSATAATAKAVRPGKK